MTQICPTSFLEVNAKSGYKSGVGSGSHAYQIKVLIGIEKLLYEYNPEAVVVYGDTNTTLAAALAAAEYIPLVHIEAGVRCGNRHAKKSIVHSSTICPISWLVQAILLF